MPEAQFPIEIPNAETIAAMEEIKMMEKHPERYKSYTDVDAMMKELLEESDSDPHNRKD